MRISDWSSDVCSSDLVDDVQIGEIARRKQAAVVEAIEQGGVAALAFHRMFERDAMAFAIAHPMLEHEGRRGGVADRAAMRAAVGEAVHRVVSGLQIFQERSEERRVGKECVSKGRT